VTELVNGHELFDEVVTRGSFSERDAAQAILQVCSATKYLHDQGIVHRDLKPENILYSFDTKEIKIADFGLSKEIDPAALMKTCCGTPAYAAPEILISNPEGYAGKPVDMWAIGVICYTLLCGCLPFDDNSISVIFRKVLAGDYTFFQPYWAAISEEAKDLIRNLLLVDPQLRFTIDQALEHPWLAAHKNHTKPLESLPTSMAIFNSMHHVEHS